MSKLCPICGSELVDNKCPNSESHFKVMCLNCKQCQFNTEDETYRCHSEGNMNKALNKIKAAINVSDLGYDLKLEPLPLKNPTKKCSLWSPDNERILATLMPFMYEKEVASDKTE